MTSVQRARIKLFLYPTLQCAANLVMYRVPGHCCILAQAHGMNRSTPNGSSRGAQAREHQHVHCTWQ